jgi:hypothetical protein
MNIAIKIWAFLTRQRLVWLRDFDGEVTLAIAKETPFGGLMAERWWPFKILTVQLEDGGNVRPPCYVEEWKFY